MDPPSVAASASDAAGLGVLLAQDLYRLASEYPNVECQIGRIAQAFVDLNLSLADLASTLKSTSTSLTVSTPCLERIVGLVGRIHGVQKTFFEDLTEDASSSAGSSKKAAAKAKPASNKLGRLKAIFPGAGAADVFTEMEWMRNTLALLAAVFRLAAAQAQTSADEFNLDVTRFRVASETLTSAVIIYVRTIEQRMAGPEDDDQSDDEEPITGPGSLLYVVPVVSPPRETTKKGKAKNKAPAVVVKAKADAADWIYEGLRDRIKENDRSLTLPSQFIEWLLEEAVVPKADEAAEVVPDVAVESSAADDTSKEAESVEAAPAPELEPEPEPTPVFLSKKAAKKLAKNKGKAKAAAAKTAEPDTSADKAADDKGIETGTNETARPEKAVDEKNKDNAEGPANAGVPDAPSTDHSGTPKATPATTATGISPADANRNRDAKIGRAELEQDHDDLPPPYPSPDAFMPHGRGPPFGPASFPFPGGPGAGAAGANPMNPMPYQTGGPAAPGPFDMPYIPGAPAMFPVGFYPMHAAQYMGGQPFFGQGPRGGAAAAGGDAFGASDPYDSHAPNRPSGGMRRSSFDRPYRDGSRGAPRRRPGYGKYDDDEHFDDDIPGNRRRGMGTPRRRESGESQESHDNKENDQDGPSNSKSAEKSGAVDEGAPTEMSLERLVYRPKKAIAASSAKPTKKGNGKAVADNDDEDDVKHYSDAETVDIRDAVPIASNSGKKRGVKGGAATTTKRAGQSSKDASPPPPTAVLPAPPTPPSAVNEEDVVAALEASSSKPKKLKGKAKRQAIKAKAQAAIAAEEHHSEPESEPEKKDAKDKDDSEYESAKEGKDDDENDDDNNDRDADETQFSPDTEHRVFTPPPTPPHVPHPGEAHAPPAAHGSPAAHAHGAPPGGFPTGMPYFAPPNHPMMAGAAGGAGADANMEALWAAFLTERMGMPPSTGAPWPTAGAPAGATSAPAGMNAPRGGAAAGATGHNSNWIRGEDHAMPVRGPPPPTRAEGQTQGHPPSGPSPPRPQQWDRYRNRGMRDDHDDRRHVFEHSEDEDYEYGHYDRRDDRRDSGRERDRSYDSYDYGHSPPRRDPYHDYSHDRDHDRDPEYARRRSRSPPYHPQDHHRRQYHEQQRQQRSRYHSHLEESPSPPRGWERDREREREQYDRDQRDSYERDHRERDVDAEYYRRDRMPPLQQHQQQHQQQFRDTYNDYFEQMRRAPISKPAAPAGEPPQQAAAATDWGWPGDVKQPGGPGASQQMPSMPNPMGPNPMAQMGQMGQMGMPMPAMGMPMPAMGMPPMGMGMGRGMPPMPQMTPQMPHQMPHLFPHGPPPAPPPGAGWDDGWNEAYRQARGHAEFAMTEIDG